MWALAVWKEVIRGEEKETDGIIPLQWIKDKFVCWPVGVIVTRYCNKEPDESWVKKYPLVKVKLTSGELK